MLTRPGKLNPMNNNLLFVLFALYVAIIAAIAFFSAWGATTEDFFNARKKAPWFSVAFGMVAVAISGISFISIPGNVEANGFSYLQRTFGYLLGYVFIATILLPVYYRYNLVSIYSFLEIRFGFWSGKTGAFFFLLSRLIRTAFRVFVAAWLLKEFFLTDETISFGLMVLVFLTIIWFYTARGGIKTLVWTDVFQAFLMIVAAASLVLVVISKLQVNFNEAMVLIQESEFSQAFYWDTGDPRHFFEQFFAGAFIAIAMNGLDQDIMQKNLSCRNLADAQKNMFWFSIILVVVNIALLTLGALLFIYADQLQLPVAVGDTGAEFFAAISQEYLGTYAAFALVFGLITTVFSSTDSALVSLTTSFCIDFLDFQKTRTGEATKRMRRIQAHLIFALAIFGLVMLFKAIDNSHTLDAIFAVANFTYGPLIGLFAFGLVTRWQLRDGLVPLVCSVMPVASWLVSFFSEELFNGYNFGLELVAITGLATFLGLLPIIRKPEGTEKKTTVHEQPAPEPNS